MTASWTAFRIQYSVEMWFWNGLPNDARGVTGYLFSRGAGDSLGIGGSDLGAGKLVFAGRLVGRTEIPPKTWNHLVLVRDGSSVKIYLNAAVEIAGEAGAADLTGRMFIGGRQDGFANFEGRVDEVAIYGRALAPSTITAHSRAAGF